jgi:hypothetical protein
MGGAISWSSKKQRTVALSTVEAEYMALSFTTQEAIWLRSLIKELDPGKKEEPINIFCDNKGAIHLAKNSVTSQRSKHIDVRHHFFRNCLKEGIVKVSFVSSEEMISDILTKPLSKEKHFKFLKLLGLKGLI